MTHESINIDLPDLQPDPAIRADNILIIQVVYFAAQLEELNLFDVIDVLVQKFLSGALPLDQDSATQMDDYVRQQPNRLTGRERRNLYSYGLGVGGDGPTDSRPNREFNDLWSRFLASVEEFVQKISMDALPGNIPPTERNVMRAARDLALNLSMRGYGIGHFAAAELQREIKGILRLLSAAALLHAFSAPDLWHVVERVSGELGRQPNIVRYRTTATSGAVIIRWLSQRVPLLASKAVDGILDMQKLRSPQPSPCSMVIPTDRDLVEACHNWLAVASMV